MGGTLHQSDADEQLRVAEPPGPLISVVVPVYNVEPYVRECLESIRSQTYDGWEAIVVDDCSTDGSMRVVSEAVASDGRFRVVHLTTNSGLGNARNVGIAEAKGDYIMLLDSDDYLEPFALERVAQVVAEVPEPDIVWFDYAREWWSGKRTRNMYGTILGSVGPGPTTIAQNTELLQILPIAPNKAYRRAYLESVSLPFPTGLYEDVPFVPRPAQRSVDRYHRRGSLHLSAAQTREHPEGEQQGSFRDP